MEVWRKKAVSSKFLAWRSGIIQRGLIFSNSGHEFVGVDINKRTVDTLKAGKVPFKEKSFQELMDGTIC
ncbi:hypothetical protein [Methanosarcina vacuolata]|uniref:hypothetical protein n=1 Tax=Methanosarcina vacuolata TaxID=2215 RepID=UPI0009FBEE03